jgi:lauroyl/myristoyl acyltransferase
MFEYWVYRLASLISRVLPMRLAYWVGLRVADMFYRHNHAGRQAVTSNLRQIYLAQKIEPAEEALEGLTRKTFQYFGKYLVDFFRYSMLSVEDVRRIVSVAHVEYLDETVRLGRGVILLTAHFGNWELGGAVLTALGYRFKALVLPQRIEKLNRLFQSQRESRGMQVIPVGNSALGVMRSIKRGEVVALLADRDFTSRDDRITFFGKSARLPKGPAWLSKHTGAPIVPGFLIRQVDDTFLLRIHPPIFPENEPSEESLRQTICSVLEKEIGERPYQWFIFDDFWAPNHHNPPQQTAAEL